MELPLSVSYVRHNKQTRRQRQRWRQRFITWALVKGVTKENLDATNCVGDKNR
jgi:hypothetical protein